MLTLMLGQPHLSCHCLPCQYVLVASPNMSCLQGDASWQKIMHIDHVFVLLWSGFHWFQPHILGSYHRQWDHHKIAPGAYGATLKYIGKNHMTISNTSGWVWKISVEVDCQYDTLFWSYCKCPSTYTRVSACRMLNIQLKNAFIIINSHLLFCWRVIIHNCRQGIVYSHAISRVTSESLWRMYVSVNSIPIG